MRNELIELGNKAMKWLDDQGIRHSYYHIGKYSISFYFYSTAHKLSVVIGLIPSYDSMPGERTFLDDNLNPVADPSQAKYYGSIQLRHDID